MRLVTAEQASWKLANRERNLVWNISHLFFTDAIFLTFYFSLIDSSLKGSRGNYTYKEVVQYFFLQYKDLINYFYSSLTKRMAVHSDLVYRDQQLLMWSKTAKLPHIQKLVTSVKCCVERDRQDSTKSPVSHPGAPRSLSPQVQMPKLYLVFSWDSETSFKQFLKIFLL